MIRSPQGGARDEEDLSAESEKAEQSARIPEADEHEKRTESTCPPPPQR